MLLVKERVERSMEGLDLRLGSTAKEAMALGEVDSMVQHVQLGEGGDGETAWKSPRPSVRARPCMETLGGDPGWRPWSRARPHSSA